MRFFFGGFLFAIVVTSFKQLLFAGNKQHRFYNNNNKLRTSIRKQNNNNSIGPVATLVATTSSSNTTQDKEEEEEEEQGKDTHHQQERLVRLLPIDQNSTIASDIRKIWHDIDSKEICVELKQDARCPHPALVGRLSGPALAILEWKERRQESPRPPDTNTATDDHDDAAGTVLCGGYDHYWLDPGDYFVEILIVLCNDYGIINVLEQRTGADKNNNMTAWLEADHTFDCVEDADHNRITSSKNDDDAVISISTSSEGRDSYRQGRWIRKPGLPNRPLYTRYQPKACRGLKLGDPSRKIISTNPMVDYCRSIIFRDTDGGAGGGDLLNSTNGLYEYEFQWNMKVTEEELLERIRERMRDNNNNNKNSSILPRICALGDSHSQFMHRNTCPKLKLKGLYVGGFISSVWPSGDQIVGRIAKHNCDIFLTSVGQWPASFKTRGRPFSFGKYHNQTKTFVENILKFNPNATIYLPTVDPGPLMGRVIDCDDWRVRPMTEGYTYMLQLIEKELKTPRMKAVDTKFIVDTHWDGNPDWNHLMEIARARKVIYTAAIMLGETEWAGLSGV